MDKRLGVYICSGCSIGDAVDVEQLVKIGTKESKGVCKSHPFLCGDEGLAMIRADMAAEKDPVNKLVIAACSPRQMTHRFAFDPHMPLDRVNLREQVAWTQKPKEEDTQMLAEDYLRMGIVKVEKSEPLEPPSDPVSKTILVVGGGITGIHATLEAAQAGYEVVLIEKEPELGGFVRGLKKRFPTRPPYTEAQTDGLAAPMQAVLAHPKVQVKCSSKVAKVEGQPGAFDVTIAGAGGESTVRVGTIIMATGWKPYDASKLAHLGYGTPDVVTNVELEQMAAKGPIVRPSNGKPVGSVLFVQCAGSRDKEHLPYCSGVCCMNTFKQAEYIREQNADAQVYVIYKDIITPGPYEKYYEKAQNHPLNFLTKGDVTAVASGPDGKPLVSVQNTLLGENLQVAVDLVVLAAGMVPNSADNVAIRTLRDARAKVARNESETQVQEAQKVVDQYVGHEGTEILNLTYRQGPDLPVLRNGFPDSNFICFPYESMRTGIYAAGAVRAAMDARGAEEDARGAAMKAIQSVELASVGQAVHPRAGDLSFPSFFLQRCTQCKRCTEECPFGSLDEDVKGTPKFNPYRCRRCGVCMGACPERIVSFKNYSVDMIASMVKSIEVPDETEEKPRILLFVCENDAYPALDQAAMKHDGIDPSVRIIPLRCLGSMNIVWIADALSRGVDGVMLMGCKFGDDYQCHFVRGSELANRRLENVKETLQRLQLEPQRIKLEQVAIDDWGKAPQLVNEFAAQVRDLGPNPYKGF